MVASRLLGRCPASGGKGNTPWLTYLDQVCWLQLQRTDILPLWFMVWLGLELLALTCFIHGCLQDSLSRNSPVVTSPRAPLCSELLHWNRTFFSYPTYTSSWNHNTSKSSPKQKCSSFYFVNTAVLISIISPGSLDFLPITRVVFLFLNHAINAKLYPIFEGFGYMAICC